MNTGLPRVVRATDYDTLHDKPDTTTVHRDDWERWARHETAHYARKRIQKPADWGLDDDDRGDYIVELFALEDGGGQINIWDAGESSLEHIWKPATVDGDPFHKVGEQHAWDGDLVAAIFACIKTATDCVDVSGAGSASDLIHLADREDIEF